MVKSSWLKEKLASMRSGMRWGLETGSVSYEDPTGDGVETMPKGWPVPVGGRGLLRAGVGGWGRVPAHSIRETEPGGDTY